MPKKFLRSALVKRPFPVVMLDAGLGATLELRCNSWPRHHVRLRRPAARTDGECALCPSCAGLPAEKGGSRLFQALVTKIAATSSLAEARK